MTLTTRLDKLEAANGLGGPPVYVFKEPHETDRRRSRDIETSAFIPHPRHSTVRAGLRLKLHHVAARQSPKFIEIGTTTLPQNGISPIAKKFSTQLQRRRKDAQGARKETLQRSHRAHVSKSKNAGRQTLH